MLISIIHKQNQICKIISIEDFNELGFSYGDSVNVEFDNGKSLQDMLQSI